MSDKVDDGGPAFPREDRFDGAGNFHEFHGLTKREYYAGQALAGCLASNMDPSAAVRTAWLTADAMLAARKGARDE